LADKQLIIIAQYLKPKAMKTISKKGFLAAMLAFASFSVMGQAYLEDPSLDQMLKQESYVQKKHRCTKNTTSKTTLRMLTNHGKLFLILAQSLH
jgi:hypothetical protein